MKRASGFILAFGVALLAACGGAAGGAGGAGGGAPVPADAANPPRDDDNTRVAGVHLAQATLGAEGAEAHFQQAMTAAMAAIQADSTNPKAYMLAGQAAAGLGEYGRADEMFDQAEDLYPPYEQQLEAEREEAWVTAYNQGTQAMSSGDLDTALEYFQAADVIYDGRAEARMALGAIYTRQGQADQAADAYASALEILEGPVPEGLDSAQTAKWRDDQRVATFNAAQLMAQGGRYEEAADLLGDLLEKQADMLDSATQLRATTARAGFLAQAGRSDEAEAIFEEVLNRTDLTSDDYFQVGIGFFNTGDYPRAAEAFEAAAELNPYSRDALLNLVQSLYSAAADLEKAEETPERNARLDEYYEGILEAAEQVRAFDPLNRNVLSFMLRAYRAQADQASEADAQQLTQQIQELYRVYQNQTYEVSDISLTMTGSDEAELTGVLANLSGTAGEQVQIRFSTLDTSGNRLDTQTIELAAPAEGEAAQFRTTIRTGGAEFAGWEYELMR